MNFADLLATAYLGFWDFIREGRVAVPIPCTPFQKYPEGIHIGFQGDLVHSIEFALPHPELGDVVRMQVEHRFNLFSSHQSTNNDRRNLCDRIVPLAFSLR